MGRVFYGKNLRIKNFSKFELNFEIFEKFDLKLSIFERRFLVRDMIKKIYTNFIENLGSWPFENA